MDLPLSQHHKSQSDALASNTQAYPRVLFPYHNEPSANNTTMLRCNTTSGNTSSQASSPSHRELPRPGALDGAAAVTKREEFPLSKYYPFTHEPEQGLESPLRSFKDESRERRSNSCQGKQQQSGGGGGGGDNPSTSRERNGNDSGGIAQGSHHRAGGSRSRSLSSSHGGKQAGKQALIKKCTENTEGGGAAAAEAEIHNNDMLHSLLLPGKSKSYGINAKTHANTHTDISSPPPDFSPLERVPHAPRALKRKKHGWSPLKRSKDKVYVPKATPSTMNVNVNVDTGMKAGAGDNPSTSGERNGNDFGSGIAKGSHHPAATMNVNVNGVNTGMKAGAVGGMNVGAQKTGERRDGGLIVHRKRNEVSKKSGGSSQSSRERARKEDEKGNRGELLVSNALEETRGLELDRGQQGDKQQDRDGRDKREMKEDKGVKLRMRGEKGMKRTFERTPNALTVTRGLELDGGQQGDKQQDRDGQDKREMEHQKHEELKLAWVRKMMKRNIGLSLSPNEIQVTGGLELDKQQAQQGDAQQQDRDGQEKREMKEDKNEKLRLQGEKEMKKKEDELEKNKEKKKQVEHTNAHEKVELINNPSDQHEVDVVDEVGKEKKMERKKGKELENEEKEEDEGEKLRVLMWLGYNAVIKQREQEVKERAEIKREKMEEKESAHSVLMWLGEQIAEARRRKASAKMAATKFMFGQKKEAQSVMTSFRQCATNIGGDCVAM